MNVGNAITALRAGWVLRDPKKWKNRQQTVNAIATLLTLAVATARGFGYALHGVTDEMLLDFAFALWSAVGMFNGWGTAATSDKVGFGSRPVDLPPVDAAGGASGA